MTTFAVACLMLLAVVCVRPDFKQDMLDRHNYWRARAGAANMYEMTWHEGLENDANRSAKTCSGDYTNIGLMYYRYNFTTVGENIAFGETDTNKIVDDWHKEKKNYEDGLCESKPCRHYTQVVWAESFKLGCAQAECCGNRLTICMYGPAGNVIEDNVMLPPYNKGKACTNCTNENNACTHDDKLCVGPPKCADTEDKETCEFWVYKKCETRMHGRAHYTKVCKKSCNLCDYY